MVPEEKPRLSRWVDERDGREVRDELLAKNRKGGGWQRCASAKFGNWRRGAERSLTKALGGRAHPNEAGGGDWRANPKGGDEAGGAIERV